MAYAGLPSRSLMAPNSSYQYSISVNLLDDSMYFELYIHSDSHFFAHRNGRSGIIGEGNEEELPTA